MTEFDKIIESFNKISLEDNKDNKIEMAPQVANINWSFFKSKLNNIKPYDGDSNTLNKFISRCDALFQSYADLNNDQLNAHIFECIQEKLIDKAELNVGNRTELQTCDDLKNALVQCFSDRRDLDCLVQELTRNYPYKNEHLLDFGSRIQLLMSTVIQRISNDVTLSINDKICQTNHHKKTALNTFIAGCPPILKNNLHLKKPATLEDAMAYVTEFENFEKLYGNIEHKQMPKINVNHNNQNIKPNNNFLNTRQQTNQKFYPFTNQNNNSRFYPNNNYNYHSYPRFNNPNNNQQFSKPIFPRQPINVQPIPEINKKYFTNRQVFGENLRPQNVFKPNQINSNQLPKPEPMSTTSRNPSLMRNVNYNQRQNYFQNNQKPNFSFEELNNTQTNLNKSFDDTVYQNYALENECEIYADEPYENYNNNQQYNYKNEPETETQQDENFRKASLSETIT